MLKGRDGATVFTIKLAPLSAVENSNFSLHQDTLPLPETGNLLKQSDIKADTAKNIQKTAVLQQNTFQKNTLQINNTKNVQSNVQVLDSSKFSTIQDSISIDTLKSTKANQTISQVQKTFLPGKERYDARMDWFTILIIFSLFVFSWIKIAYQKFVTQIVTGMVDYQVAMRLYREKNVLFRNVSIGLHTVFYINTGLFLFDVFNYFKIHQIFENNFMSIATYSLAVLLLYNIKSLSCRLLGYIFVVQENFAQYIHNVNLYNKNIGLFLFPLIAIYPFTVESVKPFIIYAGLVLLVGMFLLRSYRSAQIIMKKGISLFYLILYLCAVEIIPILILVKLISTWIFKNN